MDFTKNPFYGYFNRPINQYEGTTTNYPRGAGTWAGCDGDSPTPFKPIFTDSSTLKVDGGYSTFQTPFGAFLAILNNGPKESTQTSMVVL